MYFNRLDVPRENSAGLSRRQRSGFAPFRRGNSAKRIVRDDSSTFIPLCGGFGGFHSFDNSFPEHCFSSTRASSRKIKQAFSSNPGRLAILAGDTRVEFFLNIFSNRISQIKNT
jgi:hypothetical protein